jgi:hypothetical protein
MLRQAGCWFSATDAIDPDAQQPYRWSQRWYDNPPVGTINDDGGRNPEIYVGNGGWQPSRSHARPALRNVT